MAKNIIKEIIIVLLLTLAIILVLGILLYRYVPANKVLPDLSKVEYTTDEEIKKEIQTAGNDIDTESIVMTYEVTSADLANYKKVKEYVSGKTNPFASLDARNGHKYRYSKLTNRRYFNKYKY